MWRVGQVNLNKILISFCFSSHFVGYIVWLFNNVNRVQQQNSLLGNSDSVLCTEPITDKQLDINDVICISLFQPNDKICQNM